MSDDAKPLCTTVVTGLSLVRGHSGLYDGDELFFSCSSGGTGQGKRRKGRPTVRFRPAQRQASGLDTGKLEGKLAEQVAPLVLQGFVEIRGTAMAPPAMVAPFTAIPVLLSIQLTLKAFDTAALTSDPEAAECLLGLLTLCGIEERSESASFEAAHLLQADQTAALSLPLATPPPRLRCTLRPYQRQALGWMTRREQCDDTGSGRLHPLWTALALEDGTRFYVNRLSSALSLSFPRNEAVVSGGILADEMGMGKTVEMIALLVDKARSDAGPTLIVCTLSLLSQWTEEIEAHSDLKWSLFYGSDRGQGQDYAPIVLTSYGTLAAEFSARAEDSILFSTQWQRVILDEAHHIKNRNTGTFKAACALNSVSRWCLTGTPVQNSLDDLHALFKFLREPLLENTSRWSRMVAKPFERQDTKAVGRLHAILQPLMLRRTKTMKDADGVCLVQLPPRHVQTVAIAFSETERKFYDALYSNSKHKFEGLLRQGVVLRQYTHVLELLLRLRQACDHPFLVIGKRLEDPGEELNAILTRLTKQESDNKAYLVRAVNELSNENESECPICLDVVDFPSMTSCGHLFCLECIERLLPRNGEAMCPVCRSVFTRRDVIQCKSKDKNRVDVEDDFVPSAKTLRLVDELHQVPLDDKSVVFSQWTTMLDIVEEALKRNKIVFVRLDGSLSRRQRKGVLNQFAGDAFTRVLLLSLKAGGVGLNLTAANHVFLLDSWWNPAVDNQAIDRIHRIGQAKEVVIKRFVVEHSVEERILELQKMKLDMADGALSQSREGTDPANVERLKMLFKD